MKTDNGLLVTESNFQKKLEKSFARNAAFLVVIGCALFCFVIVFMDYYSSKTNEAEYLNYLERRFDVLCTYVEDYIRNPDNQSLFLRELDGEDIGPEISFSANKMQAEKSLGINVILSDPQGKMVFNTYPDRQMNSHRAEFNRIVCGNTGTENKIYNTVYYLTGISSEYVFSMPLLSDGILKGFAAVYLSGASFENTLTDYQYDCIITNTAGQIIYNSKSGFVPQRNTNKYRASENEHPVVMNNIRYMEIVRRMKDRDIILYAFLYDPPNLRYLLIGIGTIFLIGLIWFIMSRTLTRSLARKSAESANKLIDEIRIIRHGDSTHEVAISTGDEFELVGEQINKMVRSINSLNARNSDLIRLNAAMEIRNLQTQINPHFIYNTLDNIRYLIPVNPGKASSLIGDFTKILRYSIDNSKREAALDEDLGYIRSYINIQEARFGSRFSYTADIAPECGSCLVPKLLLQPIIENSIKYGFKRRMDIAVELSGRVENGYLVLSVEDNGGGVPASSLEMLRSIIKSPEIKTSHNGLQSICRRIMLEYGGESGMQLMSEDGEYFRVTMKLFQKGKDRV